jgi:hypothetical protein
MVAAYHSDRPQCRRNENARWWVARMRWMPRLAAAVTSSRVSAARLASSVPLEAGPQPLDRVQLGRIPRQRLHDQPGPLAAELGAHRPAAVGGQPVPHQRRLLPAEEAAQLAQRLDEGVGVVGVVLLVEAHGRAAAQRAVADRRCHRCALPPEVVADDGGVPAGRPGPADHRQQRGATFVPEHDHRPSAAGVAADPKASPQPPSGQWPARRARPRGGRGDAAASPCGAAASRCARDGRRRRSAARSRW